MSGMKKLSYKDFKVIVKHSPLVAIDLIIENAEGEILMGRRNNSPAKGYWFVPGGRILKDENFDVAFKRIAEDETGLAMDLGSSIFHGVYQHMYPGENFADDPSFNTHYIVIAYRIKLITKIMNLPKKQHSNYRWAPVHEILSDPDIHQNTKNYFIMHRSFSR